MAGKQFVKVPFKNIHIFVTEKGEPEYEITDLYWFEENGVHSFDEKDPWIPRFHFRIEGDFEERKVTNDV